MELLQKFLSKKDSALFFLPRSCLWLVSFLVASLSLSFASPITPDALSRGGRVSQENQLDEISEIVRPGVSGFIGLGTYYFPHPGQTALESNFGKHEGFAFRQRFAMYFAGPLGKSDFSLGFFWWLERHGFDSEDFLLFPAYGQFSLVRNLQTAGVNLSFKPLAFAFSGGIQYSNPEHVANEIYLPESDTLYGFTQVALGPLFGQVVFNENGWTSARGALRLESKEVLGGASNGIKTYLPNIDVAFYRDAKDSIKVKWEQNLFKQILYGEVEGFFPDYGFYSAALKYYPDPSRLVSLEATCFRKENGDLVFGGGISILMLRLAYNHASDIENLFGSKGTFVMELSFALGASDGKMFGRNAAKPAPMESTTKTIFEHGSSYKPPKDAGKEEIKEIKATGIRREKVK